MSGRGVEFQWNWIEKNVTDAERHGSRERAKELAARCIADAAALGITVDDMEPEWGSVETVIYETMQGDFDPEFESYTARSPREGLRFREL
jgi:hypothetical protein